MVEISGITDVMNYIEGLKVVVFDLDDTLYGEKEYVRSGYRTIAALLSNIDVENMLWKAFEEKKPAIDTVLKSLGIYTEELKVQCLEEYRKHRPSIHLYDGVAKMLMDIRNKEIKVGIITDGRPEGQRAKIKALGLDEMVDYCIITDELGGIEFRKPCKKAFVMMRDYFDVAYQEMCYVGDNIRKDFIAPEKLEMKAIWFRNKGGLYYV